jgi:hypothetical protein
MKLIDDTGRQDIGADEVTQRGLADDSGLLINTPNSRTWRWG